MSKEFFTKFILSLAAAIPRFAPDFTDKIVLNTWFEMLRKLDQLLTPNQMKGLIEKLTMKCDQFPSIREILLAADDRPAEDKWLESHKHDEEYCELKGISSCDVKYQHDPEYKNYIKSKRDEKIRAVKCQWQNNVRLIGS